MFETDYRRVQCALITFGKMEGLLPENQVQAYLEFAKSLEKHCGSRKFDAHLEAGDQRFRVHMQGMFEINISSDPLAKDWLKEYMQAVMKENKAKSIRIHIHVWIIPNELISALRDIEVYSCEEI